MTVPTMTDSILTAPMTTPRIGTAPTELATTATLPNVTVAATAVTDIQTCRTAEDLQRQTAHWLAAAKMFLDAEEFLILLIACHSS